MTEANEKLQHELAILDGWYEQAGPLGRAFKEALAKTAVPEIIDAGISDGLVHAVFQMSYDGKNKFRQAIHYLPEVFDDREEFFSTRTHEGTHAIQAFRAACLHANPATKSDYKIFLRPRDMAWAWELMEKDAYAKAAMMYVQFGVAMNGAPIRPDLNPDGPDLQRMAIKIVKKIMDAMITADTQNAPALSAKEYYNRAALQPYETYADLLEKIRAQTGRPSAIQAMKKHGFAVPTYVRLEPRDIADIGASFGPNLFLFGTEGEEFSAPELSPAIESLVRSLNERLEIEDEENLPPFGAALEQKGLDRSEFLRLCRA